MQEGVGNKPIIEGIAYHEIRIDGILSCIALEDLRFEEGLNQHATLYLKGLVPEEVNHKQVFELEERQWLKIRQVDSEGETVRILFQGLIENIRTPSEGGLYYVYVKAISNTSLLDLSETNRSFHDPNMGHSQVLALVNEPYEDMCRVLQEDERLADPIRKFILQYNESDWRFSIRLASLIGLPIIPSAQSEKIDYYIGLPKRNTYDLSKLSYTIRKTPTDTQRNIENELVKEQEGEYFTQFSLHKCLFWLEMGDRIHYRGLELYVIAKKAILNANEAMMYFEYVLTTEKGSEQPRLYNESIVGLSIGARVIDHTHTFSRLSLYNEEYQEVEKSLWFRHSVFHAAGDFRGWTAMYDIGDNVELYFPTHEEHDAIVMDSSLRHFGDIRAEIDYIDTVMEGGPIRELNYETYPDFKMMFNPEQHVVAMDQENMLISTPNKESFIVIKVDTFNDKDGILLSTQDSLVFEAGSIDVGYPLPHSKRKTKKITLTAMEKVKMHCGSSDILLKAESPVIHYSSPMIDIRRWKGQSSADDPNDYDEIIAEIDMNTGNNRNIVNGFTPGSFTGPAWSTANNAIPPVTVTAVFDPTTGRLTYTININAFIDWERGCYIVPDAAGNPTDRVI